jgi:hypothetical protein
LMKQHGLLGFLFDDLAVDEFLLFLQTFLLPATQLLLLC